MFNDHCKWFLGASSILVIFPSTSLGSKICTFLKIDFREEGGVREKRTLICCSTYLCIHWLIPICALTRDQTHNLGVLGQCSNQLSYLARAECIHVRVKCVAAFLN